MSIIGGDNLIDRIRTILGSCSVTDLNTSHWGGRIKRAANRTGDDYRGVQGAKGCFTAHDEDAASNWTVCACGKLSPNIKREGGEPVDETLNQLGIDFSHAVDEGYVEDAALILVTFEERADAYLLEQAQICPK